MNLTPHILILRKPLEIIDQVKPKQTFFTHISHNMGFHEEVCSSLPKSVSLAFDGLVLEVD
jgi:phosphoribosyl 1,2-cyclic phosphate phosphodiesterase